VTIVNDEARSYLARQAERFDIVQMSFIDTWAATAAGAYVLSENTLYTVEGWRVFLEHLTDHGLLAVSRATVPAEMHRLVALARGTLTSLGVDHPERHIALVANYHAVRPPSWGPMALVLVGREALSAETVTSIERTADRLGFTVLLKPGFAVDQTFVALATGNGLEEVNRRVQLNYDPPTDDSPFFFNMLRPRDWLRPELEKVTVPAMAVLMNVLLVVVVLTTVCIVLPLFMRGGIRRLHGAGALFVFFAAIGLGFMLIEVSVMQRLIIFLGHPVYGLTVILFVLLLGSGAGAFLTSRIPDESLAHRGRLALAMLCVALVMAGGLTRWLVREFAASQTPVRVAASGAVLAVMGVFMGMAFPLGMRAAARRPELTPWLWGLNGAMSVLASVLAIVIAIASGIATSYWCGVGAYAGALGAFLVVTARPGIGRS
jgi:predicted membrane-bound spermidine synthase